MASMPKQMTKRQKKKLESDFREDIIAQLDIIWELVGDESFTSLARRSGLCEATLYRLWGCSFAVSPMAMTMWKLGQAVGLNIQFTADGVVASLSENRANLTLVA